MKAVRVHRCGEDPHINEVAVANAAPDETDSMAAQLALGEI